MKKVKLVINDKEVLQEVSIADNFITRLNGLMFKKEISESEGILISPCNSIHMFFMSFPLDVLFVSEDNEVIAVKEGIKPWRISKLYPKASYVVECKSGTINKHNIKIKDILNWV